jgi:hypothetical protein
MKKDTAANWFAGFGEADAIKRRYRDLVKEHHPDLGGDTATMQDINGQYETRMRGLYGAREGSTPGQVDWWAEQEAAMMEVIASILRVSGRIEAEIIGVWIWVTGDTRAVKTELKGLGCRWSPQKEAWYWRSPHHAWRRRSSGKDLDGLRRTWGSMGRYAHTPQEETQLT